MAWLNYPISHGYITDYQGPGTDTPHYAVDLAAPFHTPFFFPVSGTVRTADYAVWSGQPGGGEVFLQPDAGGPEEYVYHLDQIDVKPGQHLAAGQEVGLSGGQNSGGEHNVSPMWSSGPHIHFGYFSQYVSTPAGNRPYGPDPTNLIQAAAKNTGAGGTSQLTAFSNNLNLPFASSQSGACTPPTGWNILNPIAQLQWEACVGNSVGTSSGQPTGGIDWKEIGIRAGIITAGVLMVVYGLYGLVQKKSIINIQEMPQPTSVKNTNPIPPPPPKVIT
jgi:murein DD-endopeptidase MepM/ murein hydrolase activator NlpD